MKENTFIKTKISNLQLTKIFSKMYIQNEIKPNNGDNWSQIKEYIIAKILYKYKYHEEKYIEYTKISKKRNIKEGNSSKDNNIYNNNHNMKKHI